MKRKSHTNASTHEHHGEVQPYDEEKSSVPKISILDALEDAYAKVAASCPDSPEEQQIRAAAQWALQRLHISAQMAKKPGLKAAISCMETGFQDIGKAMFPTP